jgi:CoA:oxalate CoA-transferase
MTSRAQGSEVGTGPLAGIRIIDFTQFLSGPYATMIMGDLGAQIIKIENPAGELARQLPPHFIAADSLYYLSINRNKRSVAVDLKAPQGVQLVRNLIATADVVIENFRPGVLARLGFDSVQLRQEDPRLIWCSISGFGQDGPARDWPAYDIIVQALSGGMSLTGESDGAAVRSGIPVGDLAAGMFAVIGILAALAERNRSGQGRAVDISMLDCQISMLTYQAAYYLHSGIVPGRQGRGHDSIPTYRSFTARDGRDIVVAANTEEMWQALCAQLEARELVNDPRFSNNALRLQNKQALWAILEQRFQARDAADWIVRLRGASVPVAEVNTLERALAQAQVAHRQMIVEMTSESGQRVRAAGNPVKFDGTDAHACSYPPSLGQDSHNVLKHTLGLSDAQISNLIATGIVAAPPAQ